MWLRISGRVDDAGGRYDPLRCRPLSPPSDARSRRLEIRPQNGRPRQSPNHLAGNPAVNGGTQHPHAIPRFHLGALPEPEFGACGPFGIVDIDFFDAFLDNNVLPALQPQVNAGNFPIFMLYNTVLAFNPITDIFNTCCVLGYHGNTGTNPIQAYSPSDFDTTGVFGPTQGDSNTLSHEVAEFVNDPFGDNPTPAWGGVGQVPPGFCQNNLEVGDPLSGTNFSPIGGRNGFTYHLQELAFFSWFYSSNSTGIHDWFSDNDTFTTDAGPVYVPAAAGSGNTRPIVHP